MGYPRRAAFGVYPRACGGTSWCNRSTGSRWGLSPRVRGNHWSNHVQKANRGSIPARAGEPSTPTFPTSTCRVYPRACGGTFPVGDAGELLDGLSPRVRGNRKNARPTGMRSGSIPARAGEPLRIQPRPVMSTVYPRACGGTSSQSTKPAGGRGLSPRVRGNQRAGVNRMAMAGSIPARAGEPRILS